MEVLFLWFFFGLFWAAVCAAVGKRKAATVSSFILGFLLGPLGLLVVVVSNGNLKPCSACRQAIHPEASVCPHCRTQRYGASAA